MSQNSLVVVGAGTGGYPAAFLAADLGLDVTLIDQGPQPGGVCLYRGCIASKAFLHAAFILNEARSAGEFGLVFQPPEIQVDKLRAWKDTLVEKLTSGLGQLCKTRKVQYVRGHARFAGPREVRVRVAGGKEEVLNYERLLLAAGSHPAQVPGFPVQSPHLWNSTIALDLPLIPKRLLVVGGGYIGLELGSVYAALGSEVTVVEMMPALLPGVDRDLVSLLSRQLKSRFKSILLNTRVAGMYEEAGGLRVQFEGAQVAEPEQVFDKVLVAVGRKPNTVNLGLEQAGVQLSPKGFVQVDAQRRTTNENIWAAGDIAGEPMLAHKATHEGRTAVQAMLGQPVSFAPKAIPAVVFTDPEVAWCGLTETQAKAEGRDYKLARFPWAASGRAATLHRGEGVTKLLVDPGTEKILGVAIVGPGAGDMIAEGALAIEMDAGVKDLARTIHPHPTLSETLMEAAEVFHGHCAHFYQRK